MAQHDQLAKILGLLESNHDGEVLSAARRAVDYLRTRKLRWGDVLGASAPERRGVERRLLELRDHARSTRNAFDKEEQAELKAVVREFTLNEMLDPSTLRRIEWLEAIAERAASEPPA